MRQVFPDRAAPCDEALRHAAVPGRQRPFGQDPGLEHVQLQRNFIFFALKICNFQCNRATFQLHMVSQKTAIKDEYYRNDTLANKCLEAFNRQAQEGSVSDRVLMPDSSRTVFMRGGGPP